MDKHTTTSKIYVENRFKIMISPIQICQRKSHVFLQPVVIAPRQIARVNKLVVQFSQHNLELHQPIVQQIRSNYDKWVREGACFPYRFLDVAVSACKICVNN